MSYSKELGSKMTNTKLRTPEDISQLSGMCSVCTDLCVGTCELGLSALRGDESIYLYKTDEKQFASEKEYPLDFSHFNINGRVFGTYGCKEDPYKATFPKADINTKFGLEKQIDIKAPIILPAMAKLNWKDYFAGAALAGVPVVIGESVAAKDKDLELSKGKVVKSPLIKEMLSYFNKYDRGYGDIVLQANYDDEELGVLDYAVEELGVKSVELKFGQGAKGIQGTGTLDKIEDALAFQEKGYLIYPDPSDPEIIENYNKGIQKTFQKIGKLPMWNEEILVNRVKDLKELGAERVCFKTGPFDPKDLIKILKIASKSGVDLITFDGAGGGTGNSPGKLMNEWGIPTVYLESLIYNIAAKMKEKGYSLPQICIAGGFATEDQVFKGLALGSEYINMVGIGRAAMAAAMSAKKVGELLKEGKIPKEYKRFGSTKEELFREFSELKGIYGEKAEKIPTGAIGVYSYLKRISTGLKQLMALNRKFNLKNISREDIVPITELSQQVTGLKTYDELMKEGLASL